MSLVVMGHGAGTTRLHRQPRLGAVESLDLALLIDAEHDRVLRRVEVEPDDVGQLLQEAGIVRQLEGLNPVGLEAMIPPDPVDRIRANPSMLGHRSAAPVGGPLGRGVERVVDYLGDLLGRENGLTSPAFGDLAERRLATLGETITPQQDGGAGGTELVRDLNVWHAVGGLQDDVRAQRDSLRGPRCANPAIFAAAFEIPNW